MVYKAFIIVLMGTILAGIVHVCICTDLCSGIGIAINDFISNVMDYLGE